MVRSLPFSESVSLGCDLHKCFSVSFPLCETGLQGGRELGIYLSSAQLGCDKIVFFLGQAQLGTECSGTFQRGYSFPPSDGRGGFFNNLHCENLIERSWR